MNNKLTGGRRRLGVTEARRLQLVEEFKQRDGLAAEFAKQHGVGVSTLYRWMERAGRRRMAPPRAPAFAEVSLAPVVGMGWAGEVSLPDGTQVRWNGAAGLAGVERLVSQLRRPC